MYDFELIRPKTLAEALTALAEEDAQALGGGQTLIPTLKARLAMPASLVCLSGLAEISGLSLADDGSLCIGGAAPHADVARDPRFPALAALAGGIGDPAVRTRGTVGGSVANNDPSACYPAAVLACGATVVTQNRDIAAEDFFTGLFETDLAEGEIITEIRFPIPARAAYVKFEQQASRFALVGVFVADFGAGDVRVAVTGASGSGVFRWAEAEAALAQNFASEALDGLTLDAEGMISDAHGSGEYRAHLVGVMAKRAVARA